MKYEMTIGDKTAKTETPVFSLTFKKNMNKSLTYKQQEIIAGALIIAEVLLETELENAKRQNKQVLVSHYTERLNKINDASTLFFQFRTGTLK